MSASIPVIFHQADNSTHPSWSPTSTCSGSTCSVWLAKPDGTAELFSATGANKKLKKWSTIRIEGGGYLAFLTLRLFRAASAPIIVCTIIINFSFLYILGWKNKVVVVLLVKTKARKQGKYPQCDFPIC